MANLHGLPDLLRESQAIHGDLLPACLLSTTWPTVPAPPALTLAPFATRGYVADGTTLIYVDQPAVAVTVGSSDGQYWLALFRDTQTSVVGWARTPGSHYGQQALATQPADPPGGLVFAAVLVAGSVITSVTPLGSVELAAAWRAHLDLETATETRRETLAVTVYNQSTGTVNNPGLMVDGATTIASVSWRVPEAYTGGNVTFHWLYSAAAGFLTMSWFTYRYRAGIGALTIDTNVGTNQGPADARAYALSRVVDAGTTELLQGDLLQSQLVRFGADAGDSAMDATVLGAWVEYVGLAYHS